MKTTPNILLFCTDTLRTDALRFMGNEHAISPNADRLASEGVWFDEAYTCSPVCSPARTSLLTGVYPPVHECLENGMGRRQDLGTFVDVLKTANYHTIMAGKQHFGPCPDFDVVITPTSEQLQNLSEAGQFSEDRSFDNESQIIPDAVVVQETIDAIERAKESSRPFFTFCSLNAPHVPLQPPTRWVKRFESFQLPEPNRTPKEEKVLPAHQRMLLGLGEPEQTIDGVPKSDPEYWVEALGRSFDCEYESSIDALRRRYYAYAAYADELLGRVIDYLDRADLSRDTVVIFTTDHGQQYFDHGFNDKHCWYDESWRIPLIIRHTGTLEAAKSLHAVSWMDIAATLSGIAGAPWKCVQGYDLYGALRSESNWPRSCVPGVLFKSSALVTRRWKLEYYLEEGIGRLYDRENDPQERLDLWNDPTFERLRDDLLISLLRWRSDLTPVQRHQADLLAVPASKQKGQTIVANRVAESVSGWKGTDAEERLSEAVRAAEERFGQPAQPREHSAERATP